MGDVFFSELGCGSEGASEIERKLRGNREQGKNKNRKNAERTREKLTFCWFLQPMTIREMDFKFVSFSKRSFDGPTRAISIQIDFFV